MGIYEMPEKFIPLLRTGNSMEIIQMAYRLTSLLRSSKTIQMAVDRASKVVFALKSFSHYDSAGEPVKANIIDGIETVLTLYHNLLKQGVEVIRNFEEVPQIFCFPDELNQVWTNIVHNAIQAMKGKGTLRIDVKSENEEIKISFADTGCGIPDAIKEKIFDPFFTTKPQGEGSGLGLDIVKRIIEKHKGKIEVMSEPGNTEFSIYLPAENK
jgi:signal transduction histidine kinase